jgi:predicted permease
MGVPLIRGRFFDENDRKDSRRVILINDVMARRYWPEGDDPVGQRISFSRTPAQGDWLTVAGVVGDVKDRPESAGAEPAFWWPVTQQPFAFHNMCLVLRSPGDPAPLAAQLRAEVQRLNPGLAVADVRLLDDVADASMATPRVTLFLVGLFAALAVTLAAIGIFGVISYAVTQRTSEFGLRLALGASPGDVLVLVMRQGMGLAIAGVLAGVAGSLVLARLLQTLLYEVSATDPLTFATVPLIAIGVAAIACFIPARRATRADPATALRAE